MKLKLYVVYDKVAKEVATPIMTASSDEIMIRTIKSMKLNDIIESNLGDFELHEVGSIDTIECNIVGLEHSKFVQHLEAIK